MDYTIAKATLADVPELNNLVNGAYRGDSGRQGWTTEADLIDGSRLDEAILIDLISRADTAVLLFRESGTLLGCVELRQEGPKLYLGMLSVQPTTQGKGIGKKLLAAAEEHAVAIGCRAIKMVVISVRAELIAWYQRHGYALTGERKPFVAPDERWGIPKSTLEFVVMEKRLTQL
jgi:ribosomal protein S18 acetylase RimI-like enzyme